ncbi:MAG: competence/damage-inducible protein A [Omnitrophica WOR_2 bacterium RIFCSPHIGHO2_02_FULL_68_15]|nr:MAG: competence/damage-inducible protein A [Omnitrophica WOR_2 bacterium RIFCSPHIGHO2_02_FULL_68_15]
MNVELIAIGTELLLGWTVNTNTAFLSRRLAELGVDCYHHVTVGDNPARLAEAVRAALGRSDCVVTCGGLGPTVDDITLPTLTKVAGRPLVLDHAVLGRIRERFTRMGIPMPQNNLRQAYVPRGALVLANTVGTAPGFLLPLRKKLLIALPGPPKELEPMVTEQVVPWLKTHRGLTGVLRSRTLHLTGITESEVDERVADLLKLTGAVTVGIYAHAGQVDLRITAKGEAPAALQKAIHAVEHAIRARLGAIVFGADEETLEQVVGTLLTKSRKTVALAESCTGGLIGHRLTQVPGSSAYFLGGAVAYANAVKTALIGVPAALVRKHGAVSDPVVRQMAAGIRKTLRSDYGLAVTGIAGPSGGTAEKPVGTVHLAVAGAKQVISRALHLTGDRAIIKARAAQAALDFLRTTLTAGPG